MAFFGMILVLHTDYDLSSFIDFQPEIEDIVVHPLFTLLQTNMKQIDQVDQIQLKDINSKLFYQKYLNKYLPLHVVDGCLQSQAVQKWTDLNYLKEGFGSQSIEIHKLDKSVLNNDLFSLNFTEIVSNLKQEEQMEFSQENQKTKRNNFGYFIDKTKLEDNLKNPKFMYYINREMIVSPQLRMDLTKPDFIGTLLSFRFLGLTIWKDFIRKPEFSNKDRYVCVIEGQEMFRLVSPIFKQNIYSGVLDDITPDTSPLNFFKVNLQEYPLWAKTKYLDVTVGRGECLYIPSFYWIQTKTLKDRSIFYTYEFQNNSEMLKLLFEAIDIGILEKN